MNPITPAELAAYFDHTQLRAYAQRKDFEKLCAEAREYGFAMVAINPAPVSLCKDLLAGTSVHVGAAVGFPLGQSTPKVKKYETVDAIANGADEIDYVINITQLKEKNYDFIEHEMAGIVEECRGAGVISKVIFENCYLTEEEKRAESLPRTKKVQFEPMKVAEAEQLLDADIRAVLGFSPVNYYATKDRYLLCTFWYTDDLSEIYMRFELRVDARTH